jgi:hypothetical protein
MRIYIYKQDSENEDAKQEKPEEVGGVLERA